MWSEFCGPATANWNGPIQSRRGIGKGGAHEGDRPKNRLPAADRAKDSPNPSESKLVTAFFCNGGVGQNRYEVDDKDNVDSTPDYPHVFSTQPLFVWSRERPRVAFLWFVGIWRSFLSQMVALAFWDVWMQRITWGDIERHVTRAFNVTLLLHCSTTTVPACPSIVSAHLNYVFGLALDIVRWRSRDRFGFG